MDNFKIDIRSDGDITDALAIGFGEHRGVVWRRRAIGYSIHHAGNDKPQRMVFYWSTPKDVTNFREVPFDMDARMAALTATEWLSLIDYGQEPTDEGVTFHKAWRVYNEPYGHVDGHWQSIVAVSPTWAEFTQ